MCFFRVLLHNLHKSVKNADTEILYTLLNPGQAYELSKWTQVTNLISCPSKGIDSLPQVNAVQELEFFAVCVCR